MHMTSALHEMDGLAQPMHAVSRMQVDAAEPLQPMHAVKRMEAVEPMQPFQRMEAAHAPMAPTRMTVAEPMHHVEQLQPMQRMEAVQAPMAPTRMEVGTPMYEARTASDATMTSGVSMTAGAHHEAVQPMQAREMYISPDSAPAEPMQSTAGYEPMARTQMSHTFEALEPTRESYNPLQARTAYSSFEAAEPMQSAAAYEAPTQSGGAPVQPLLPTVAHERPTKPTE